MGDRHRTSCRRPAASGRARRVGGRIAVLLAVLVTAISLMSAAACSSGDSSGSATTTVPTGGANDGAGDGVADSGGPGEPVSAYDDPANWLCRPDLIDDLCDIDLTATLVRADGSTQVEPFTPATDAPIDCFYAYPTVSGDPPPNADRIPGPEEENVIANQFARFAEVCRTFAPSYQQVPIRGLAVLGGGTTTTLPGARPPFEVAYADVLDAWQQYQRTDGADRRFVLIGHSQGAGHLRRLIAEEIDDDPAVRDRMVSALLIGSGVPAPGSPDAFENVPPCTESAQTGCVVSYATFESAQPPPPDSLFGRVRNGGGRVVCTNPAALGGGSGDLDSYYPGGVQPGATTPFVRLEGWWDGRCVADEQFDWLQVTSAWAPGDQRPDDLGGRITPQWGLHLVDVNVALGNLIDLVRTQSGQA